MIVLGSLVFLAVAAAGAYYLRIHLEWRAEVRRRRAERERERAQLGYGRMYSLVPDGNVDVVE